MGGEAYEAALTKAREARQAWLLVHSEKALAPALARAFYDRLEVPKQMVWLKSAGQIDFYDDPALVGLAADQLVAFFDTL